MIEVIKNLYVGNDTSCSMCDSEWAIVHACKSCHQKFLRYKKALPQNHPSYLVHFEKNHLFLNLVDMERMFLPNFTHPIMKAAFEFLDEQIPQRKVLIHCNQGQSRSAGVALAYMAKKNMIKNNDFKIAYTEFKNIYTPAQIGIGFELYLGNYWNEIMVL
ncbi:phosphatase [Geovibrio thiophilus]|uniref:Phosphatase n=1 Tax=Geovibrio thiophilus TaxID=139438 RepID=A0A410K0V8_9BACT|nr:dual specificity protein phosphatase [Geovibrio thiophilus]QAR34019.1 phosphatase [Geovibrio thiophilus]